MIRLLSFLFAVLAGLFYCVVAQAQNWPTKPLRFVSPFAPGGGNDSLSRIIAAGLTPKLGQQVVVENKPGANTIVGTEIVVKSAPDGYTFILLPNAITINPHLYKKQPFDVTKDLTAVTQIGTSPLILCLHPSVPIKNTKEFLQMARAKSGQFTNGSSGNGSLGHLAGALLGVMTGINLVHIPYKGTSLAVTDLLGGQITLSFSSAMTVLPHIRNARLRAVGVTSAKRSPALPDIAAISETVPGFSAELWYAMFAPANLPLELINRMNHEISALLTQTEMKAKLSDQGVDAQTSTPQEMAQLIVADLAKWEKVVKITGAKAN
jgi:hypothetical protein